jgi:uncharacterized protein (TIGR02265 family)
MSTIPGKLVEAVFKRVLAPDLTPGLISQLAAVELTAKELYPHHPLDVQLRRLGGHIIHCLQSRHIIKSTWLSMAKLMGPRRALKQAMDFTDRSPVKLTITERAKNEFAIVANDTEQPDFLAGLLESAITMLGGKSAHVALESTHEGASHFRATWR